MVDHVREGDAAVQADGHEGSSRCGREECGVAADQRLGMVATRDISAQPWPREYEALLRESSAHGIVIGRLCGNRVLSTE